MGRMWLGIWGAALAGVCAAAPKAGPLTTSWQLDVRFQDLQRITLQLPGDREPTTFWYLVYEVTNNTGGDVPFYPSFELVTDTLRVVEGGSEIPPRVYEAVVARHEKEFPFLAPPTRVTGRLLQGEANARASAAVFREFDPGASGFTVYAAGFAGEVSRVSNPAFDAGREESGDNLPFFALRRTLAIRYDLPGAPETRSRATPIRRTREWVMR